MGEYAHRKPDGEYVKIGTCENMYYCRWEQRDQLYDYKDIDNLFWRLPIPTEDELLPGEFSFGAWRESFHTMLKNFDEVAAKEQCYKTTGIVQTMIDELGILVNVKCYHGLRLPQGNDDFKAFFNGKKYALRLIAVKNDTKLKELRICVSCTACEKRWSCSFNDIEAYIYSLEMRLRLFKSCQEYWEDCHEDGELSHYIMADVKDGHEIAMTCLDGEWQILIDGRLNANGDFEDCSAIYRSFMSKKSNENNEED